MENEIMQNIYQYESDGFNILNFDYTSCEENGWYSKIQENSEL